MWIANQKLGPKLVNAHLVSMGFITLSSKSRDIAVMISSRSGKSISSMKFFKVELMSKLTN